MTKAIQEIVADLRKADMSGAQVDAGHVADQIALAVGGIVEAERQRVVVSKTETTTVGNAAAMRGALVVVKRLFDGRIMFQPAIRKAHKAVDAALSAPPRNCDVGTPDEQVERWQAFCDQFDDDCTGCPCDVAACASYTGCFARWAQTPYAAEEGAGK